MIRRRKRLWGQAGHSLAEFAIVLPMMLGLLGAAVDMARVYQGWITLQSATRNAAEFGARFTADSASATSEARRIICLETSGLPGYQGAGSSCSQPTVAVTRYERDLSAGWAPPTTVTVETTLPFRTLVPYPLLTSNGSWTLSATATWKVIQAP